MGGRQADSACCVPGFQAPSHAGAQGVRDTPSDLLAGCLHTILVVAAHNAVRHHTHKRGRSAGHEERACMAGGRRQTAPRGGEAEQAWRRGWDAYATACMHDAMQLHWRCRQALPPPALAACTSTHLLSLRCRSLAGIEVGCLGGGT